MKTLRADSIPVEFYNEGLVVFLYDERNADAIRDVGPPLLEGFNEEIARDPALACANDAVLDVEDAIVDGWIPATVTPGPSILPEST